MTRGIYLEEFEHIVSIMALKHKQGNPSGIYVCMSWAKMHTAMEIGIFFFLVVLHSADIS